MSSNGLPSMNNLAAKWQEVPLDVQIFPEVKALTMVSGSKLERLSGTLISKAVVIESFRLSLGLIRLRFPSSRIFKDIAAMEALSQVMLAHAECIRGKIERRN